jgi:membrane-bound serine protease (ClpP class)
MPLPEPTLSLTLAYVLIAAGFLLLAAELFVPVGGLFLVGSVACFGLGLCIAFVTGGTSVGLVTLLGVFVMAPALVALAMHYSPRTPLGRRLFLRAPEQDETIAQMPVNLELEQLRGHYGRAVGALRPAGVVDFNGRRVDCLTEGMMVDDGCWVRCIDVRAGRVVVRQADPPTLQDLEAADFS